MFIARLTIGNCSPDYYWSSTEIDNSLALAQNFTNGSTVNANKGNQAYVRAVRAF